MSGAKFIDGFFQVTVCNEQSNAKLKNSTLLGKTMWISIHDFVIGLEKMDPSHTAENIKASLESVLNKYTNFGTITTVK